MNMHDPATEVAVTKVATAAQYVGSGGAVVFGLTASEWSVVGVIGGLVIAVVGLIVNVYFKNQHLRLARDRLAELDE